MLFVLGAQLLSAIYTLPELSFFPNVQGINYFCLQSAFCVSLSSANLTDLPPFMDIRGSNYIKMCLMFLSPCYESH